MADDRFNIDKFITDKDKAYIAANIKQLKERATSVYTIPSKNVRRLDLISYDLYGTVNLKWLLIYLNDIIDISVVEFGYRMRYVKIQDLLKYLFETAENQ